MGKFLRGSDLATDLLVCVAAALDDAADYENALLVDAGCDARFEGRPGRVTIVPASTAYESCECGGELVVYPERRWATNGVAPFPAEGQKPSCGVAGLAVQLAVRVLRCACTSEDESPPSVECQTRKAQQIDLDMAAVVAALNCCWTDSEWVLLGQDLTGPQGGCVGSLTHVAVAVGVCCV